MSTDPVVTRFAPSPTGELHLGNARTALFNHLLARRHGGRFVLRVEDTDVARSSEDHVSALRHDLAWLGLHWELGPGGAAPASEWQQSLRGAVYDSYYQRLESMGAAYSCYCTALELDLSRRAQLAAGRPPRYAGTCRGLSADERANRQARGLKPALRFAVAVGTVIEFEDMVHGAQAARSDDIGDFIIRRQDGSAAFFFCNAIDDALMMVTHVLRGEDHLSNTPRQLLLLKALGLRTPQYGHVSLLTGADGAPLSKRHGATTVREYRELGYAPEAINNLLFRLGHSTANNALLAPEAMSAAFDATHLQKSSAHFDATQLRHWQSEWVRSLPLADAVEWLRPWLRDTAAAGLGDAQLASLIRAVQPNITVAADARPWIERLLGMELAIEADAQAAATGAGAAFFAAALAAAGSFSDEVAPADGAARLAALRTATGKSGAAFYKPLRAALTGLLHGPELVPLLASMPAVLIQARLQAQAQPQPQPRS
jgi:glutamyl-tRNA synthetase